MNTTTITTGQFIQGNYMNKLDFLSDVLEDFCFKNSLPLMSADDLLYAHVYAEIDALTQYQQNWLSNYIQVWDLTCLLYTSDAADE